MANFGTTQGDYNSDQYPIVLLRCFKVALNGIYFLNMILRARVKYIVNNKHLNNSLDNPIIKHPFFMTGEIIIFIKASFPIASIQEATLNYKHN